MLKNPRILECTLRDGSYAINFQFTEADTRYLCETLESAGFNMIEVGHGVGLGASERGLGIAAETDESYLRAAAESTRSADWGMFCIPGIAELRHLDLAAEYGMKFVRIGTNCEHYQQSQPFIERAKQHGMYVCSNFMKSYTASPEQFAEYALEAEKFGADLVYIVDSAGGMFPDDVERYFGAIKERSDTLRLGFHGHHNLGMGVANALRAIQMGADIVDSSLQGFGRSAGNTPTELLLCVLMRHGLDLNIDPVAVMDIGENFINPLRLNQVVSSVDVVAGLAQFHSSYMPIIEKFARQYRVDPRRLIIAVCQKDRANASEQLVDETAKELAATAHGNWKPLYQHYYGGEQSDF